MCVIVFKPKGKELPSIERLYDCFNANPDGAGYMYQKDNGVKIRKGFMTFSEFYGNLKADYGENNGKDVDFVMHFRISTQGGVNQKCCHPYPVSKKMEDLYNLDVDTDIGVAHNGIIHLTSEYEYGYGSSREFKQYNDTMKFITDYLSLIINSGLDLYDEDKIELIERLIGGSNKLAIMTSTYTKLIGSFTELDGLFYSNTYFLYNYSTRTKVNSCASTTVKDDNVVNIDEYDKDQCFDELYEESYGIDELEEDEDGKVDGMQSPYCGSACACRKCRWFSGCYGFDYPEEWDELSDDELDEILSYYYGGYDEEYIQSEIKKITGKIKNKKSNRKGDKK